MRHIFVPFFVVGFEFVKFFAGENAIWAGKGDRWVKSICFKQCFFEGGIGGDDGFLWRHDESWTKMVGRV